MSAVHTGRKEGEGGEAGVGNSTVQALSGISLNPPQITHSHRMQRSLSLSLSRPDSRKYHTESVPLPKMGEQGREVQDGYICFVISYLELRDRYVYNRL